MRTFWKGMLRLDFMLVTSCPRAGGGPWRFLMTRPSWGGPPAQGGELRELVVQGWEEALAPCSSRESRSHSWSKKRKKPKNPPKNCGNLDKTG